MIKKISGLLLVICLLCGWTVKESPFLLCTSTTGTDDVIYFTVEDVKKLVVDTENNKVINTFNDTVYGYMNYSDKLIFETFSEPYYQTGEDVDGTPIYSPYSISQIVENHLNDYQYKNWQNVIIAILCGIFFVSLIKEIKTKKGRISW